MFSLWGIYTPASLAILITLVNNMGLLGVTVWNAHFFVSNKALTKPAATCSKLTIDAQEEGMKKAECNNEDTRTTSLTLFWCLY